MAKYWSEKEGSGKFDKGFGASMSEKGILEYWGPDLN